MKSNKKNITSNKKKVTELFRYGICGASTTLLNILLYQFMLLFFDYRVSNLIAILASKTYAYAVNKKYVFRSKCKNIRELIAEIARFIATRGATGLLDYFGLILAVEMFGFNRVYSKYAIQAIVIVINYILGKRAVFVNNDAEK